MTMLVIAPHPDDETLGCGGTLLKAAAAGRPIDWMIATSVTSPPWSDSDIARKQAEVDRVAEHYGFRNVIRLDFPSAALDSVPQHQLIEAIRSGIRLCRPKTVLVPGRHDVHSDHRRAAEAASAVLKPQYLSVMGVSQVLSYEASSSTDASTSLPDRASVYVDISDHMERKLEAMELYESESQPEPMPRAGSSVRAAARYAGSTIGVEYAERFSVQWCIA